jgi:hypothetical protein
VEGCTKLIEFEVSATGGQGAFMPSLFVLYGQSLMKYTGVHENDLTAHG